ncbi:MAG: hypothetical protein NZR01_03640 [Bryobacteraceae bacterium]|nr:hypothetical protein [Bryobacteraceae bacterium]
MTRRRKLALAACLVAGAGGAGFLIRHWIVSRALPSRHAALVQGMPYTMTLITVAQSRDGRKHVTEQRTVAVNRLGEETWITVLPAQPAIGPLRRTIRADGRVLLAIEKLSLRMTHSVSVERLDRAAAAQRNGAPGCLAPQESEAGTALLAGVAVRGAVQETPGQFRTTRWRAPDFACLTLGLKQERWAGGRWEFLAEQRAVWFRAGDPDPQLFEEGWWERLRETPPAQLVRRIAEATGADPQSCPACYNPASIEEMEKEYYRNQRAR